MPHARAMPSARVTLAPMFLRALPPPCAGAVRLGWPPFTIPSIALWDELASGERRLVVVGMLPRAAGKRDLRMFGLLVRYQLQQVRDGVETRAPFVVGFDDPPGRDACVGDLEHRVTRARVVVP